MTTELLERPARPKRRQKRTVGQYVGDAVVRMDWHRAAASVWNVGDGIWGYDVKHVHTLEIKTYTGVLLVDKDGDWRLMAEIEGPSWASVCRAVEALGFERPKLTAQEVRRGR